MKVEIKPKVVGQVLGFRIKQMCDSKKLIKKWGVYAGKNIVNEPKGFNSFDEAVVFANKIINGEIKKDIIKN
jgi:hypothetical protein